MGRISVIVPVYKVKDYLRRCIDSILGQTFTAFDLVLVDDGSPDECGEICDQFALLDERIHVIHQPNQGLSEARNAGIEWALKNSDSEWITFIDSDDWIHREYLKVLYNSAIEYNVELSICNCIKTSDYSVKETEASGRAELYTAEEFWCFRQYGGAWAKLYRKNQFSEIRYPKGLLYEDVYVTYRLIFMQKHVVYIEDPLYYYYLRDDSITKSQWNPKVLAQLAGMRQQLRFFKINDYSDAYRVTVRNYILDIKKQAEAVAVLKDQYCKEYLNLQILFRIALIKYHRYLPILKYTNLYRYGFPVCTKIYKKFSYLRRGD